MITNPHQVPVNDSQHDAGAGSAGEFITVIIVLIVAACTAVSLLLATPQSFEAAARSPTAATHAASETPDLPFHERHPVNAVGDQVDSPTF